MHRLRIIAEHAEPHDEPGRQPAQGHYHGAGPEIVAPIRRSGTPLRLPHGAGRCATRYSPRYNKLSLSEVLSLSESVLVLGRVKELHIESFESKKKQKPHRSSQPNPAERTVAAQKGPDPDKAQSFSTLRSQCSSSAVNAAAVGPIPISTRAISVHHIDSIQSLFCCQSNIRNLVLLNLAAWWRLASRAIGLPENPPVFVPIKKPP